MTIFNTEEGKERLRMMSRASKECAEKLAERDAEIDRLRTEIRCALATLRLIASDDCEDRKAEAETALALYAERQRMIASASGRQEIDHEQRGPSKIGGEDVYQ